MTLSTSPTLLYLVIVFAVVCWLWTLISVHWTFDIIDHQFISLVWRLLPCYGTFLRVSSSTGASIELKSWNIYANDDIQIERNAENWMIVKFGFFGASIISCSITLASRLRMTVRVLSLNQSKRGTISHEMQMDEFKCNQTHANWCALLVG